jgi:hypothetical protein
VNVGGTALPAPLRPHPRLTRPRAYSAGAAAASGRSLHPEPAVQRRCKDRTDQLSRDVERDFFIKTGRDRWPDSPRRVDAAASRVTPYIVAQLAGAIVAAYALLLAFERLLPELPGILNLAIKGWHRLQQRGYFQQPASSDDVAEQFEDISSPIKQFIRERCDLGDDYHVTRDALFSAWCTWCKAEGRDHPGTNATLGKDLSAAFPELQPKRVGNRGEQVHGYSGIKADDTSVP